MSFLKDLQAKYGLDGFSIGSYQIGTKLKESVNLATGQVSLVKVPLYTVSVALYSVKANQVWWRAKITRSGNMTRVARVAGASLAANIGKGRLRNL